MKTVWRLRDFSVEVFQGRVYLKHATRTLCEAIYGVRDGVTKRGNPLPWIRQKGARRLAAIEQHKAKLADQIQELQAERELWDELLTSID